MVGDNFHCQIQTFESSQDICHCQRLSPLSETFAIVRDLRHCQRRLPLSKQTAIEILGIAGIFSIARVIRHCRGLRHCTDIFQLSGIFPITTALVKGPGADDDHERNIQNRTNDERISFYEPMLSFVSQLTLAEMRDDNANKCHSLSLLHRTNIYI